MDKNSKEGTAHTNKTQLIIVFLIGFLFGLLIGPTFSGDNGTSVEEEEVIEEVTEEEKVLGESAKTDTTTVTTTTVDTTLNNITVTDQIAGDRVLISLVSLSDGGWVVVHEIVDGVPANALGAQRFDMGVHKDMSVDLLRQTEVGHTYVAILYSDNGDGMFSLGEDIPFVNTSGEFISATFQTIQIDRRN